MKIVMAPNAFKGTFTAGQAAEAMATGARLACPQGEIVCLPVSDGGDGLVEVMAHALKGEVRSLDVRGPLGAPVSARFCWIEDRSEAVVEMAQASGLALLRPEEMDPTRTSTFGTGQLIRHALDLGARRMLIGIGGSATCDGGMGMASALGIRFLDAGGELLEPGGGSLQAVARIEAFPFSLEIDVACDVANRLLGEEGAARIYSPQKGATPDQVELLEKGMRNLADRIERDLGIEVTELEGGGAAGGLGAGLFAFLGARLRPGADVVLESVGFSSALEGADLVLTGEGRVDEQTLEGKAPFRVAQRCREQGVPCYAVAGSVEAACGFDRVYALSPEGITLEQAAQRAVAEFLLK